MTVDYDGVIVGGTLQGREAAAIAAREGARVALVEPPEAVDSLIQQELLVEVLAQAGQQVKEAHWRGMHSIPGESLDWGHLDTQVSRAATLAYPHLTLAGVAACGVDVVPKPGRFSPQPKLTFITADRPLRARGFVLCPGTQVTVPGIPGLATTPYWTVDSLSKWTAQPKSVVILGRSGKAIALAQSLALLGTRVTLISRGERLLPTEDEDISTFVESLLVAAGVELILGQRLNQVKYDGGFTIDRASGEPIQAAHLLLATAQQPALSGLNLEAMGIRPQPHALPVDDRLSTAHPRVFACGPVLGGYWAEATDSQDVPIALRNALYLPWRRLTVLNRVGWLATVPAFARIGMTASQARRWYGPDAQVVQLPFSEAIATHLGGDITGFCRWIVHRDGRLLGAQLCGPQAKELMTTVALIVQQNLPIPQIDRLSSLPHANSELLTGMVAAWQHQRWQPGTWRRNWAENWFNWRRSRPHY